MKRNFGRLIVFLMFFVIFWSEPAAAAWQTLSGDEIFVRKEEVFAGDLWVTGNRVEIAGRIKGDLLIFADELKLSGKVDGDVLGVVGRTVITGEIEEDFRGLSAVTQIDGTVAGNISTAGTELVLGTQSKVGSLMGWYARAQLLGEIADSALVNGSLFNIEGKLGGDLRVGSGQIIIGENAVITGDFIYPAGVDPVFEPGYKLGGQRRTTKPAAAPIITGMQGIWFLGSLLTGLLWLLLFPQRWNRLIASRISWRRIIGFGIGSFVFLPVLSILVALTIVGLPLGIGLLLLSMILLLFGELPIYLFVGRWFCGLFRKKNRIHPAFLFLVGGFVFAFLKLIPVVGFFFAICGRILGNGLLLTYLFWTENPVKAAPLQA